MSAVNNMRHHSFFWGIAACLIISAPSNAVELYKDPLRSNTGVSTTSTKGMLPAGMSCDMSDEIPSPLTLIDAVQRALCSNPGTREAWAIVKSQAALIGVSRSAYLPTLEASGSFTNLDQRVSFPGIPGFGSQELKTRSNNLPLNLTWVLYDFGLRAASRRYARALFNAANASQDDALQTAFFNTAQTYYEAQAAQANLDASLEAENIAKQSFQAVKTMTAAGVSTMSDELQAQTAYAQAHLQRVQANGDFQLAIGSLDILVGGPPDRALHLSPIGGVSSDRPLFHEAINKLMSDVAQSHPKIIAAQQELAAAQAQVDVTRAEGRPTLALILSAQHADTPLTVSQKEVFNDRSIGIQFNIPLFEGFSRKYKVNQARAQVEVKEATLSNIKQQVSLSIWKYFQELQTETESLDASDIFLRTARESFAAASAQYKSGYGSISDLLKAQGDLASAEERRIVALTSWQSGRLQLAAAMSQLRLDDVR